MINDKARDSLLSTETEIYHRQLATKIKGFDNIPGEATEEKEKVLHICNHSAHKRIVK